MADFEKVRTGNGLVRTLAHGPIARWLKK